MPRWNGRQVVFGAHRGKRGGRIRWSRTEGARPHFNDAKSGRTEGGRVNDFYPGR